MGKRTTSANIQLILVDVVDADSRIDIELNTDISPYQAPLIIKHYLNICGLVNLILRNNVSWDPWI